MSALEDIRRSLGRRRFPLANEFDLQDAIARALEADEIAFERERRLSSKDIVDFFVCGIAIEVKIKGGKLAIYRQVERYAAHEEVERILLVTSIAMSLPADINGTPASVLNLARAWL